MGKTVFLCFFIAVFCLLSGCIAPQDISVLDNRVTGLELDNARRINREKEYQEKLDKISSDFEKRITQNKRVLTDKYAELKIEINALKEKIRILSGKIDETAHKFEQNGMLSVEEKQKTLQRLDDAVSRNFHRLVRLEQYMGFEPSESLPDSSKAGDENKVKVKSEQGLYKQAKKFLDLGNNDKARAAFEEFIKLYPESDNADNARFWIADSYYRDKWYEKAILEYQKVIEKYPKGNKVSAALLKQGFAFANIGEKANARLLLKELIKKYPDSNEAKIAKDKLKVIK